MTADIEQYPIFDERQMRAVVLGNPELLRELTRLFLEDTQSHLHSLEQLATQPDARTQVTYLLHAVKGEARSVAALRLGAMASNLEIVAKQGNLLQVFNALPALRKEFLSLQRIWNSADWERLLTS